MCCADCLNISNEQIFEIYFISMPLIPTFRPNVKRYQKDEGAKWN